MASENEHGGLPAVPASTHASAGYTFNLAGIPIPLRRTFSAIDKLLSLPIETLGEVVEKKLKANLESHVEAVQRKRKKRGAKQATPHPSLKKAKLIAEWAENAAEIDVEDEETSALWRALLDEIMDNENDGADLLRIVREIPNADLRFFLTKFDPHPGFGRAILEGHGSLINSGLLRRTTPIWVLAYFGSISIMFSYFFFFRGSTFVDWLHTHAEFQPVIGVFLTIMLSSILLFYATFYKPNILGRKLLFLYHEYTERESSAK